MKSTRTTPRKPAARPFFCTGCGNESLRWFGQCPSCREWNTLVEAPPGASASAGRGTGSRGGAAPEGPGPGRRRWVAAGSVTAPRPLAEVELSTTARWPTGIPELDRVLGGGVVPGSLLLVGGDPGIGKSTLMLQLSRALATDGARVLYVAGEESAGQVRLRAERLGALPPSLLLLCETDVEEVLTQVAAARPAVVVVDSIQTAFVGEASGAPGSVSPTNAVWIESTTTTAGRAAATWVSTSSTSVSQSSSSECGRAPRRSARRRTWPADSSPAT
jgi:DNA repair protein RadA/Sms